MTDAVKFTAEDGSTMEFYVEEQARVNGTNYLLVTDSADGDEAGALILKDISSESCEEAEYVPVEDGEELEALLKVFKEMLDDDTEIRM